MNLITFLLTGLSIFGIGYEASSQDDRKDKIRKPLYNPMYSTHNYKHPQMAAAARSWEQKKGVAGLTATLSDAQLANYKKQTLSPQPVGGITVEHTPSTNVADRNYKIQRLSKPQPLQSTTEYYIKKEDRKNRNSAVGD